MKKLFIISILILLTQTLYSKEYNRTEDIINDILNESSISDNAKKKQQSPSKSDTINISDQKKQGKDKQSESGSLSMSSPDEVLLKTGIQLFNSSLYSHALDRFKELITKYPQSQYKDSAAVWTGKIYIRQYKYNDAIKQFSTIPKDSGEYPTALFNIGKCHMLLGNTISSIDFFQKVASQFPDHELADNALLNTGKLFLKKRKGNQSLSIIIKVIKYYKSRETIDDAYYLLGNIFEKDPTLMDLETARRIYKIFLKKADEGNRYFKNSPLKVRVRKDLKHIEKTHFRLEN